MAISSYKDLVAWQKSFQPSKDVYKLDIEQLPGQLKGVQN
jgi:hypothetical protein